MATLATLARLLRSNPTENKEVGIGGFKLEVRVKEEITQENEIPNIPLEDGSIGHDHVIIKPDQLTIKGDVSKIHVRRTQLNETFSSISEKVDTATVFLPRGTTDQIRQIRNVAATTVARLEGIQASIRRGLSLFNLIDKDEDPQQAFFDQLTKIRRGQEPIQVSMPFHTFDNMFIVSFRLLADNQAVSAGFELTLQEVLMVKVETAEKVRQIDSETTKNKIATPADKGVQTAQKTEVKATSWLYDFIN